MLFDTDVVIWALRGSTRAAGEIDADQQPRLSDISYMELLKGARNQSEQRMLKRFLLDVGFELLPVDPAVCHRAVIYMEAFALCSGLDMADALIGATSSEHGLTLCTADDKHYRAMSELELRVFRP